MAPNLATATLKSTGATTKRSFGDRFGDVLSVKDFGAIGDGVADDGPAIQATFNAAFTFGSPDAPHDASVTLNKAVYFPAGTYKITAPLRLRKVRSARIFGDGKFASTIQWSGGGYNGNTMGGNAVPQISCMLECFGFADSHISDLQFSFGSSQDKNTACIYAYTDITSTAVEWENIGVAGATYGFLVGPASPGSNNTSEYHYTGCRIVQCGTAGVRLVGANTLNHNFINCSIGQCGTAPITSTFVGSISGNVLNVTDFTASASNPPLAPGMLIYDYSSSPDMSGVIKGNTQIDAYGSPDPGGGVGMYLVNIAQTVSSRTMYAMPIYYGGLVNITGSMPFIAGCDFTGNPYDIIDFSANNLTINGIRSESSHFVQAGAGTAVNINSCSIGSSGGSLTCHTRGSILIVDSVISGSIYAGCYVYGTDGINSLPQTSFNPPVTSIIKQLSGTANGVGEYLMDQTPSGDLGSFTCTALSKFLYLVGSGNVSLNDCEPPNAVIVGSNNSMVRVRNNGFNPGGTSITADVVKGFAGQILEYDVASTQTFTVANLPTAAAKFKGVRMFVTDSTIAAVGPSPDVGNFGLIVAGGGSFTVPVWCDGTNWRIG